MPLLANKTALVTGATSGIGFAAAARLADEGAEVFITGRRPDAVRQAADRIGAGAIPVPGDVANNDDLVSLFATVAERGRGLDVVFANAGVGSLASLPQVTREHYTETFDINVAGTLFVMQHALPFLNPGASVILAGSTAASSGTAGFGVYAASKAAIRSFARTWAVELADRDIRVNAVAPGPIDTPGLRGLVDEAQSDVLVANLAAALPLRRAGQPAEVADVVLFLATDMSRYITGVELFVDGGLKQQ